MHERLGMDLHASAGHSGATGGSVTDMCYSVNRERVVHETIDQETILIDLESGTYFSLEGTGSEIWSMLAAGMSMATAAAALRDRYVAEPDSAERALTRIVAELVAEGLLSAVPEGRPREPGIGSPAPAGPATEPFVQPVLRSYTDMEYFLRLDPIHEVDEDTGWPQPTRASA
jgi:hypothetical protein